MKPQEISEQPVEVRVIAHMLDVTELGEPFDNCDQDQDRQLRFAPNYLRDLFPARDQATLANEPLAEGVDLAPEELLILELFLSEPQ